MHSTGTGGHGGRRRRLIGRAGHRARPRALRVGAASALIAGLTLTAAGGVNAGVSDLR